MWALLGSLISKITGNLAGQLRLAYEAKLRAANETERLVADVAIKDIERQMADRQAAKEVRLSTAGFWEMRLVTFLIAGCATLHYAAVTLDTVFRFGWSIPKFPAPMDEWQQTIILSFFGVQAVGMGFTAIAAAIRGRR